MVWGSNPSLDNSGQNIFAIQAVETLYHAHLCVDGAAGLRRGDPPIGAGVLIIFWMVYLSRRSIGECTQQGAFLFRIELPGSHTSISIRVAQRGAVRCCRRCCRVPGAGDRRAACLPPFRAGMIIHRSTAPASCHLLWPGSSAC